MTLLKDTPLGRLLASPLNPGTLLWIGLRPAREAPLLMPQSAMLIAGRGIVGDRYQSSHNGARQATLIAAESLSAIASFLGRSEVAPELLRRNFVTTGINLVALKGRRFRLGAALLEYSGDCAPCSRMEAALGPGGYHAVRGHGGITARIIEGGEVHIWDAVLRSD